ncbi:hypothetical protein [Streptomyces mirabilis]|uniref:hypothetical protein n=1 Tax=Streptomyces mirabilis TaxID=68239 RepID=UPI003F4DDB07
MIVEPGPAGVLPLAEQCACPSEIRGPSAQGFKIISLPLWRVPRSHPSVVQSRIGFGISAGRVIYCAPRPGFARRVRILSRLRIRWEIRAAIHQAFLTLGCAIICWRRLKKTVLI